MNKVEIIDGKKKCGICDEVKDWAEFNRNKKSKDGHAPQCRVCANAYSKQYRKENAEKTRAYGKKYREDNAEQTRAYLKEYREDNAEQLRDYKKQYYVANREKVLACNKRYATANRERVRAISKRYSERHPVRRRAAKKRYREKYPERVRTARNGLWKQHYYEDPNFRLTLTIRQSLRRLLKGKEKYDGEALVLLGCTVVELQAHLEAQFTEGMSDETYGTMGWHVDHIRPLSDFDPSDPEQRALACHFTNLQPLWWWDNLSKGSKWEPEEEMAVA